VLSGNKFSLMPHPFPSQYKIHSFSLNSAGYNTWFAEELIKLVIYISQHCMLSNVHILITCDHACSILYLVFLHVNIINPNTLIGQI
jgi:hypothetical protein